MALTPLSKSLTGNEKVNDHAIPKTVKNKIINDQYLRLNPKIRTESGAKISTESLTRKYSKDKWKEYRKQKFVRRWQEEELERLRIWREIRTSKLIINIDHQTRTQDLDSEERRTTRNESTRSSCIIARWCDAMLRSRAHPTKKPQTVSNESAAVRHWSGRAEGLG